MPKFLAGLFFLVLSTLVSAQNDVVYINGYVKDDNNGLKLAEVKISLIQDGKLLTTYTTPGTGKFELDLAFDHDFEVHFDKPGYVAKFLKIDTRNVPKEDRVGGFGFDIDMSLFETIEGVNFDLFKQPVGIAKFTAATHAVNFDFEYTKQFLAQIEALKKQYQKKVQDEAAKLKAEQAAAEAEKQKQLKFEALVKEGDAAMTSGNFSGAVFKYSDALTVKPATKYVEEKLAAAKKALDDLNSQKEKEAKYREAITAADKAFAEKNYKASVVEYNKALNHKPTETYPKTRIKEAEEAMAAIAKTQQQENSYKTAIAKGDSIFKLNKFEQSIIFYQNALTFKPSETYPQEKITEARTKIDELSKLKAIDDQYKASIAIADKAFTEKRYEDAIKAYQQASAIKNAEAYPKTRITEAQSKLDAAAKQKALDEQYKGVLATADKNFADNKLSEALAAYNEALVLKPAELYPKNKINEVKAKLAEQSKKEVAEKQYQDLIAKGDQQLASKSWNEALTSYTEAAKIKPTEQYPKDKIAVAKAELDKIAKEKDIETKYKAAVAKADLALTGKQYPQALAAYQEAKALKPAEEYPATKITETQKLIDELNKQKAVDADYKSTIAKADSAFKGTRYTDAIALYQKAQGIKPAETYPANQITAANQKIDGLNKQKALDEQYAAELKIADDQFKAKDFEAAIESYKKASAMKSLETYPKTKITEAQNQLATIAKQQANDKEFADLMTAGAAQVEQKDWATAQASYQKAGAIKPGDQKVKDQLALVKGELDKINQQKAVDAQYAALVAKGDKEFGLKQYDLAVKTFQQASGIKPGENYPKERLKEIETIQASINAEKDLNKRYTSAISKADSAFKSAKYEQSIGLYNEASAIKPAESYPKTQVTAAQNKINELAKQKEADEQYKGMLAKADADLAGAKYDDAISGYKQALAIRPTDVYPKNKITEAQNKLNDIAKNKAKEEQYTALVDAGDSLLNNKDYGNSILKYQAASLLKPTEQYPKDQLAKAKAGQDAQAKQKAAADQFNALVTKGDQAFSTGKWGDAVAAYESALKIKGDENYPREKIVEANSKLAELEKAKQEKDDAYKKAVGLGDEAMAASDFSSAKVAYTQALGIKPTEAYPKQKIAEADAKLAAQAKTEQINKQYEVYIQKADMQFRAEDYAGAVASYTQASTLKPTEQYPKDKIAEANKLLAEQKSLKAAEEQYKSLITKADADLAAMSYESALKNYEAASKLKPEEQYPKDKMEIARLRLSELNAARQKEQGYKDAIAKGDAAFTAKNFNGAITSYEQALTIKANEAYPTERIKMANAEMSRMERAKENDDKYKTVIFTADSNFNAQLWRESISTYKMAQTLKPTETYPATKIKEAEAKIAEADKARQLKDAKFAKLVQQGDSAFNKAAYPVAKNFFTEAFRLKPSEKYPKQKLDEIEQKLDELAKKAAEPKDPTIVSFRDAASLGDLKKEAAKAAENQTKAVEAPQPKAPAPKVMYRTTTDGNLDEFRRKLGENYPEGRTEEFYVEGNKKIYRTIFVKEKLGDEYLKIVMTGVGNFYFKNGDTPGWSASEFDRMVKDLK